MKILIQSKNNNVVSLTDAELAALSVPSVKIETVKRDEAYEKDFADMSGEDFYHTLQFHYHAATCGKISADKFRVILRDVFSYLDAHNISIADNNLELDDETAFKLASRILNTHCDNYVLCEFEPYRAVYKGDNHKLYFATAEAIADIAIRSDTDPAKIFEIFLNMSKGDKSNVADSDK